MKITQNEKVTEYINNTSSEQKELFGILRQLIHKTISGTTEATLNFFNCVTKSSLVAFVKVEPEAAFIEIFTVP